MVVGCTSVWWRRRRRRRQTKVLLCGLLALQSHVLNALTLATAPLPHDMRSPAPEQATTQPQPQPPSQGCPDACEANRSEVRYDRLGAQRTRQVSRYASTSLRTYSSTTAGATRSPSGAARPRRVSCCDWRGGPMAQRWPCLLICELRMACIINVPKGPIRVPVGPAPGCPWPLAFRLQSLCLGLEWCQIENGYATRPCVENRALPCSKPHFIHRALTRSPYPYLHYSSLKQQSIPSP